MSEALFETDFNKMNHKQLCEKVEELYTIVAKLKRELAWQFENIDETNLGTGLKLQNKNMSANITATAEKLSSVYTKVDGQDTKISTIEQTAEEISSTVSELEDDVETAQTNITQNANAITMTATRTFTDAVYKSNTSDQSTWDKTKVYYVPTGTGSNCTYYYYDTNTKNWATSTSQSIYSSFGQTASGFALKGDMIVDGSITAGKIASGAITGLDENGFKLGIITEIPSGVTEGKSGLMMTNDEDKLSFDYLEDASNVFSIVYNADASDGNEGQKGINFYAMDLVGDTAAENTPTASAFLGHSYHNRGYDSSRGKYVGKTYPKGVWDFSSCTVTGLNSTVAVFG